MAQTKEGAAKVAAAKCGLTVEDYTARREQGLKRCTKCKAWQIAAEAFCSDPSRYDGFGTTCFSCRRVKVRKPGSGFTRGYVPTAETRAKMSAIFKGRPNLKRRGQKHTIEARAKISAGLRLSAVRGPAHHAYKDGKKAERHGIRLSPKYVRWRYSVFLRDRFTCQGCGDARGGNLNAHHIRGFAEDVEARFDLANGITLCWDCHDKEHAATHRPKRRTTGRKPAYVVRAAGRPPAG